MKTLSEESDPKKIFNVIYKYIKDKLLAKDEQRSWQMLELAWTVRTETENELLSCPGLGEELEKDLTYNVVFDANVNNMFKMAK